MTTVKKVITIDQLQVLAVLFPDVTVVELLEWLDKEETKKQREMI